MASMEGVLRAIASMEGVLRAIASMEGVLSGSGFNGRCTKWQCLQWKVY